MAQRKKLATEFENEVKDFLAKLDFADVEGGRDTFRINNVQIDACGGHDETLLIVECSMAIELKGKSVAAKISELRGKSSAIERGIKAHPRYSKYKQVRYILATKNIGMRKEDYNFANAYPPRVYVWNENFIEYYEDLHNKIGKYAKFNLLGEIGVKPSQRTISYPAFMTLMGNRR